MKHYLLCLLLVWSLTAAFGEEPTKIPPQDLRALREAGQFHPVARTAELPRGVLALCAEGGTMAEPGQNWQVTDVVSPGQSLAATRLIWAEVGAKYCVVHYERGGIAHRFLVLVTTLPQGGGAAKVLWRGEGRELKDYAGFLIALDKGDGRGGYPH